MGRNALRISHLVFADDLLLFAKATTREASILIDCLDKYLSWSSQIVNNEKSSVHFSRNFEGQVVLPILVFPRNRERAVDEIKVRFFQKIASWKEKVLFQAGRTVMIKSVASAILSYLMSFYTDE